MIGEELEKENRELVEWLKKRGMIKSKRVEEAFLKTPRHCFVRRDYLQHAYVDAPLPTFCGQTISQPSIVAYMLEALDLKPKQKVLEIGAGSGWNACLIARIVEPGKVITIERYKQLVEFARKNIEKVGVKNVEVILGDGKQGYEKGAPYDRIVLTAACKGVPEALFEQLKDKGKLLAPVGNAFSQWLVLFEKSEGKIKEKRLIPCVFVPLV